MKKHLLRSMLFLIFVSFTGLVWAQNVTLYVVDSSMTLTDVKAKGQALDNWATLYDMVKTEMAEANIWSLPIPVTIPDGDYEWGAVHVNGDNEEWLPPYAGFSSNPTVTVAGGVATGDTLLSMPNDEVDVVFSVDMSFEISKGGFDVTTDSVGIAGPLNDWSFSSLTKGANDSVYSGTFPVTFFAEYKFRKNEGWEGSPNRVVYVDGTVDPVVLDTVWYSNISPAPLVTIKNYVIDSTEYYTGLQYKGEITGWGLVPMYDDGTNGDETADDHIWTVTLENVGAGASYEWGAVDADENWLIAGPNRVVEVAMDGTVSGDTSYVIPPWGDVGVTFMVDMNCHINLGVFDRDTGCGDVNIDGYPPVEMTYADTGVWAVTITRFSVGEELAYTYRINCAWETLNGDYDEYPGEDNNRVYTVVDGDNIIGVELYQDDELGVGNNCPYTPGVNVEPIEAEQLRVYPNPVYQELHVAADFRIRSIDVFSITGQKVISLSGINKFEQFLNVETLEQGLYIISVNGAEGERAITKVLKNR